jgi:HEAT repeat protein
VRRISYPRQKGDAVPARPLFPHKNKTVADLIPMLADKDGVERDAARRALVRIGRPAVGPLIAALQDPREHVRWEAAKALFGIADPAAAPALVAALEDKHTDVRWVAAEGLHALGDRGLRPLLAALVEGADSDWLREGAHHVLHRLVKKHPAHPAAEVLAALEHEEPQLAVPVAAQRVLNALRQSS